MVNQSRIELTEAEFQALCSGDVIFRDGVGIILQDMGVDRMQLAVRRGMSETARRLHTLEQHRKGFAEL